MKQAFKEVDALGGILGHENHKEYMTSQNKRVTDLL